MSKLKLQATDGSAGTVSLKAPASTTGNAEFEFTLPGDAGSNGKLLSTNGSGVLSWSADLTYDSTRGLRVSTASGPHLRINPDANDASANARTYLGQATGANQFLSGSADDDTVLSGPSNLLLGTGNSGTPTEKMRISGVGDVSIGGCAVNTFTNYQTLTIGGARAVDGVGIDLERSDGNIYGRFFADANGVQIQSTQSGDYIRFETGGANERLRIESDGKVCVNRTTALDSNYVNFSATKALSAGIPQNQINIGDAAAYNTTDNGGAIGFSAIYSSGGAYTTMASIEGVKTNNTDGNYNGDMVFKTRSHNGNNVTRMRLTDAGLCFGTDTAAVNALSDYEEGTFLPTAGGWSAAGTTTYTAREGYYIKIGQQVTVWLEVTWSDITNGSGVQAIGGFPFAHTGTAYSGVCWTHTENLGDDVISGKFGDGYGSGVLLYKPASGSEGYVAVDSNGGTVRLTCTYVSNT